MLSARGRIAGLFALLLLLLLALLSSMTVGARHIDPSEVWHFLLAPDPENPTSQVVWQSRVPRTAVVLLAGAGLAVSGALMQAVTRNPMADSGILGINAGASLAVVMGLAFLGLNQLRDYMWFALAGAFLAAAAVFAIGNRGPANPVRMTLAGVAIGAVLTGASSGIVLSHSEVLRQMRGWSAGTTASQPLADTAVVAPMILLGLLIALASARALDVVALGNQSAVALGAHPARIQLVTLLAVTLLAGGATAIAGPIGFLGLVAPHAARMLVGPHQGWIISYCLLIGPALLGLSDAIGRIAVPGEMPVGIVTALIGAPLLVWMARRYRVTEI